MPLFFFLAFVEKKKIFKKQKNFSVIKKKKKNLFKKYLFLKLFDEFHAPCPYGFLFLACYIDNLQLSYLDWINPLYRFRQWLLSYHVNFLRNIVDKLLFRPLLSSFFQQTISAWSLQSLNYWSLGVMSYIYVTKRYSLSGIRVRMRIIANIYQLLH